MRRFPVYWLPVLIWAGLIYLFSSQSALPQVPDRLLATLVGKGAHFMEFAVLAWLLLRALCPTRDRTAKSYLLALGIAFLYALSDEFHQSSTPGRTPSPVDVALDTLGAASGLMAARLRDGEQMLGQREAAGPG